MEPTTGLPRLNEPAPQFEAKSTQGMIKLSDFKGKWVVLFSHPADFTPVCTTVLMAFAKKKPEFDKLGVQLMGLSIDSVYSHLACSDDPSSAMTAEQLQRFLAACSHFERIGAPMPLRHLANSGGVLHFPDTWLDMVRPGIALYGVMPDPASHVTVALKPALSLVSSVVYFKVVKTGRTVSYGATWTAEADTRVITLPIGYGDGYPRALSSRGQVLVRGQRHPIIGRICMDQFMVDIGPAGTAHNGDEVVLIGRQGDAAIDCEAVARAAGTIPYEILTGLNERIPRDYRGG